MDDNHPLWNFMKYPSQHNMHSALLRLSDYGSLNLDFGSLYICIYKYNTPLK